MPVAPEERISRFILYSRWFAASTGRVKPDAFIPHQPTLHGRADLLAETVFNQNLAIERDDTPLYHANIKGWSSDGKDAQRSKAIELAAASTLVLNRNP